MVVRTNLVSALVILVLSGVAQPGVAAVADDPFEQQVREVLDKGWADGTAALKAAEESFKAGMALRSDDPRLYHAYGLVLLKHHRYSDAQKQFESAAKQGKTPYLPARRLLIQLRVLRGEHEAALAELDGLIPVVAKLDPESPDGRQRDDYIAWAGRIMGFLEKPGASKRIDVRRKELDAEIAELLDGEQKELYASKKADVGKQYDEFVGLRDRRRTAAKKQEEKEKQDRKAEIAKEKGQVAEEKEKLEMTAEQWQDWLDRQLADFDRQLSGYERDYARLEAEARALSLSIVELEREIAELGTRRDSALRQNRSTPAPKSKSSDTKPAGTPAPKAPDPKPPEPKPDPKPKEKEKAKEKSKSSPLTDTPKGASSERANDPRGVTLAAMLAVAVAAPIADDRALAAAYQEEIDRLTFEVSLLRRDYAVLDQQAAELKAAASSVLAQRQAAIARYQRATGQLVKKSDSLRAWEKRLAGEAKAASEPATGKSARDRAMSTTAASLTTYVPFNLDVEKQRLLDSLAKP